MKKYIEYSFLLPIRHITNRGKKQIQKIAEILNITIELESLYELYMSYDITEGDYYIFQQEGNEDIFISFDMYRGRTDQHDMVKLGVRCPITFKREIVQQMNEIYNCGVPRSRFIENDYNQLKEAKNKFNFPKIIYENYYHDGISIGIESYRQSLFICVNGIITEQY